MNPWFAKAVILITTIAIMLIRAPQGRRSRTVKVVKSPGWFAVTGRG